MYSRGGVTPDFTQRSAGVFSTKVKHLMSSVVTTGRFHGGVAGRMGSVVALHLVIIQKSLYITVL